jgi:hypothetical protein
MAARIGRVSKPSTLKGWTVALAGTPIKPLATGISAF